MAEQHDVDQRDQFPVEASTQVEQSRCKAVDECDTDGQGDQRHHRGPTGRELRSGHLEEWDSSVEEDNDREGGRDPFASREGRGTEPKPALDHLAVEEHRRREHQGHPESVPEHDLVARVIHVPRMIQLFMASMIHRRVVHLLVACVIYRPVVHPRMGSLFHRGLVPHLHVLIVSGVGRVRGRRFLARHLDRVVVMTVLMIAVFSMVLMPSVIGVTFSLLVQMAVAMGISVESLQAAP